MPKPSPITCLALASLVSGMATSAPCPITGKFGAECPFAAGKDLNGEVASFPNPQMLPGHPGKGSEPDEGQKTIHGCTCQSACGASLDFGNADCDYCWTDDKCGSYSWTRFKYYDYCAYPEDVKYNDQSYLEKQSYLWDNIVATKDSYTPYPNVLNAFDESMKTSFDYATNDVMPKERVKVIHGVGAICKVDMQVSGDSPYTGIFQPGTAAGMVRMGSALEVTETSGMVPGIGVKFFRDGVPSANWVELVSLAPLPDNNYNFFASDFSNHIAPPADTVTKILAEKFKQASGCVTMVGLSDAAAFCQDGTPVESPAFPFELRFENTGEVSFPESVQTQEELIANMKAIAVGTSLFNVVAYETPASTTGVKIGEIVTTSECLSSTFGDSHFFVQHQRVEEDWAIYPEWLDDIDAARDCGASSISLDAPPTCAEKYA